jgi:hypothetical protein
LKPSVASIPDLRDSLKEKLAIVGHAPIFRKQDSAHVTRVPRPPSAIKIFLAAKLLPAATLKNEGNF